MTERLDNVRREMRQRLREIGLRATSSRLATLVELHEKAGPLSHEELMRRLGPEQYDQATIYRILADLTTAGMLRRMDLGDHIWRYELLDECRPVGADHGHFLCTDCGMVSCLPPMELRAQTGSLPVALQGARIQIKVSGQCGTCAAV